MRKVIVLLGGFASLVVGSAMASDGFKPSGTLGLKQTFQGNAGGYETRMVHPSLFLDYNFAPSWNLHLQWDRTWNTYDYTGAPNQQNNDYSQPVGTLTYDYGNIGQSDVGWKTSFSVKNQTSFPGTNRTYAHVSTEFDFHKYIPRTDFIKATQFSVSPQYFYGWNSDGSTGHMNNATLALLTHWELPASFSLRLNAYLFKDWYTGNFTVNSPSGTYSDANYFMMLAWLEYANTLYKFDENTSLGFKFTGGLDPYISSNRNASWDPAYMMTSNIYEWLLPTAMNGSYGSTYVLFALPQINLTYKVNKQFSVGLFFQVKYSNQVWGESEGGWSFLPQGGFNLTYSF